VTYIGGPSGTSTNPRFIIGRIVQAGDGDPELRVLFADDETTDKGERTVFEFDRKGIVASVKPDRGSHFEGFINLEPEPLFRLNSYPSMQLEMGPGGSRPTDVFLRRNGDATLTVATGGDPDAGGERLRVGATGVDVHGTVRADGFIAGGTALSVPDYVFSDGYPLMSLDDLGEYVREQRHLPDIPSAETVKDQGIDLSQFSMKLLEKNEELTVHVIAQHERIKSQQQRIEALEARLSDLVATLSGKSHGTRRRRNKARLAN